VPTFSVSKSVADLSLIAFIAVSTIAMAQNSSPYPNAITDRNIYQETPMAPPGTNVVFNDPDLGSALVRVTDQTSNFIHPGTYLRNSATGEHNEWNADATKFYVIGAGAAELAFGFNPSTMAISSLPGARAGQGLLLPLRPGSAFSFVDPDLIYGTTNKAPLTITDYRLSTATSTTVIDTTTCATQPPLIPGANHSVVSDDDITLSTDDNRVVISEGGSQSGAHPFVVVYDKQLGCRWYNTETGQIGGQWGAIGNVSIPDRYLIRHTGISGNGQYIRIQVNNFGFYVWDLETANVVACAENAGMFCAGYGTVGNKTYINAAGKIDQMNTMIRPLDDLGAYTQLVYPLEPPYHFGQAKHYAWSTGHFDDSSPVCASTYNAAGFPLIDAPYDGEIFCIETDGLSSTVWRFAHNRALWIGPNFNTQPLGNLSPDGHWFLFTSNWDGLLGNDPTGKPRSDVWIVKLD
jgi:hypothetical protein